jgi:hypothetical protein
MLRPEPEPCRGAHSPPSTLATGSKRDGKVSGTGPAYVLAVSSNRTRGALAALLFGTLAHSATTVTYSHEYSKPAQVSFDIPKPWVIDNEAKLFEVGFIVPPEPLYAFVAAPTETPASVALNSSAVPWLFATVETDHDLLPAPELYKLAPQYLESLASESGNPATAVTSLVPHHAMRQGGLSGSAAAMTVVSAAGSTSLDEVAYERGNQLWMVIAGCSASCYASNSGVIAHMLNSVHVGAAAGREQGRHTGQSEDQLLKGV